VYVSALLVTQLDILSVCKLLLISAFFIKGFTVCPQIWVACAYQIVSVLSNIML